MDEKNRRAGDGDVPATGADRRRDIVEPRKPGAAEPRKSGVAESCKPGASESCRSGVAESCKPGVAEPRKPEAESCRSGVAESRKPEAESRKPEVAGPRKPEAEPRKPGVAPSLTREQIAQAALALADEEGMEAVSIRRLAARLGKTPMALYRYFDSVQAIHAAALEVAFGEVDAEPVPGERWDQTMRRTMGSIRAMYRRHARANLASVEGAGYAPGVERHTQRIYRLHEEQGIPPEVLRPAWQVIDAFLGGFVMGEARELRGHGDLPPIEGRAWVETAERAYGDEAFASGVEIILAGIRALAAPDPCAWRTPE